MNKLIDAAKQMQNAGWTFSGAAQGINLAGWGAVGKLGDQVQKTELARRSAEKSAREQLEEIQTQVQMSERPLLTVTHIGFGAFPDAAQPFTKGQPIIATISYANVGKSPALGVDVHRHIGIGYLAIKNIAGYPYLAGGGDDLPGSTPSSVSTVTLKKSTADDQFFVDQNNLEGWDGTWPVFLYGEIIYRDRFRNLYCTPFIKMNYDGMQWASPGQITIRDQSRVITPNSLCPKSSIR